MHRVSSLGFNYMEVCHEQGPVPYEDLRHATGLVREHERWKSAIAAPVFALYTSYRYEGH